MNLKSLVEFKSALKELSLSQFCIETLDWKLKRTSPDELADFLRKFSEELTASPIPTWQWFEAVALVMILEKKFGQHVDLCAVVGYVKCAAESLERDPSSASNLPAAVQHFIASSGFKNGKF